MVWSKTQLRINYQKTLNQAKDLERLAEQMMALSNDKIEGDMEALECSWAGESGSLYVRKGRRLNSLIYQHAKSLQQTALVLKRNAENTYRAELRIIELAERRWF